jgi:hypothetical protein
MLTAAMAMDRAMQRSDSRFQIAMDRDSVREKTIDGRLIVKRTHISKANVCPYKGEEIPGWQDLGLDPQRIYNLLRDPDELAKAAPTLNGVQLLIKHVPVSADDHQPDLTVGSLGTDAEFDGEYLDNSLFVNAQAAIDAIESGRQRELSAGYHYKPDMTPGNFRGSAYDGVMRDIVFNHVALVEDGRAGPDVVVGDEALKESKMKSTKFAIAVMNTARATISPLLAMDARITLPSAYHGLTAKNFTEKKASLLADTRSMLDGKLRKGIALDASMADLSKAIDAFGGIEEAVDAEAEEVEGAGEVKPLDQPEQKLEKKEVPKSDPSKPAFDVEPFRDFLRGKGMGEDDIAQAESHFPATWRDIATNEKKTDTTLDADKMEDKKAMKDIDDKNLVSKPAMDAAIQSAVAEVKKTQHAIRVAISEVQPWVGDLPQTMAFDSAADVYRHALVMRNVDGAKTMHPDALQAVLKTLPRNGARQSDHQAAPALAMDAVSKAIKYAPGLENISSSL